MQKNKEVFSKLVSFLKNLQDAKIYYTLHHYTYESVMIIVTVPGERWEVDFDVNGNIEIEKFISNGEIYEEDILNDLFKKFSD